ncbi:MAG: hypothetical protein JO372_22065 [Solirubrobacterales bacterium]|nr:hypothetical protein [Solirubrobacterales bacterium]
MFPIKVSVDSCVDAVQREAQRAHAGQGRGQAVRKALLAAAIAAVGATIMVGLFGGGVLGLPLVAAAALIAGLWKFVDVREAARREREPPRSREPGDGGQR